MVGGGYREEGRERWGEEGGKNLGFTRGITERGGEVGRQP